MRRTLAAILRIGTLTGVALSAAATLLFAVGSPLARPVALAGVLALFATPPVRLAAAARAFWVAGDRKVALAATVVLSALLAVAAKAIHASLL
jgi:hypothetical protein